MTPVGVSHHDAFMSAYMCVDKHEWMSTFVMECHDMSVSVLRLTVCMHE